MIQRLLEMCIRDRASTEANNEIPGMNKGRIERALQKEGIEQVRFYHTDGALGYRPDDSYFNEKMVTLARLRNYTLEKLSTPVSYTHLLPDR